MDIEPSIFDQLCEPFPPQAVSWRVGSTTRDKAKGTALAYLDARDYMERLDAVVGPDNWQCRYTNAGNNATCCEVGIRIDGEWVWKSDGAGQTNFEGDKGQFSDAFKRACVRWGIGRYLYDLPAPWVELDERQRIKKEEMPKLNEALDRVSQRAEWGDRNHMNLFRMLKESVKSFCTTPDAADQFVESNRGVLRSLPVGLQRELKAELDRMRDGFNAVAAE